MRFEKGIGAVYDPSVPRWTGKCTDKAVIAKRLTNAPRAEPHRSISFVTKLSDVTEAEMRGVDKNIPRTYNARFPKFCRWNVVYARTYAGSPDPSCYHLLFGSRIRLSQSLGPDPFVPRAREAIRYCLFETADWRRFQNGAAGQRASLA
jgi:hypothetical protein